MQVSEKKIGFEKCFMRREMYSKHLLDLKDSHDGFFWASPNVNRNFVYLQEKTPQGNFNTVCALSKPKNGCNYNSLFFVPKKWLKISILFNDKLYEKKTCFFYASAFLGHNIFSLNSRPTGFTWEWHENNLLISSWWP